MSDKAASPEDRNPQEVPSGKSDPETTENPPVLALLDGILALLEDMGRLAERAAQDGCSQLERTLLQQELVQLRQELDRRVDSFEAMYGDLPLSVKQFDGR